MRIVLIDSENKEAFKSFIPARLYREVGARDVLPLGVVAGERGVAAGAMLSRVRGDWLEIFWIFVAAAHRRSGLACALVDRGVAAARGEPGMKGLYAEFSGGGDCHALRCMLRARGFNVFATSPLSAYLITVGDIEKNAFWQKPQAGGRVVFLSAVPDYPLRAYFAGMTQAERDVAVRLPLNRSLYDPALSFAYIEDKAVAGLLLMSRDGQRLVLDYLSARPGCKNAAAALLHVAGRTLTKSFPPKMGVVVAAINRSSAGLVERLFPQLAPLAMMRAELMLGGEGGARG